MSRVNELLKGLEGWETVEIDGEKITEIRKEQEREGREIASLFHQTFVQNPAGARILEIMLTKYVAKPVPDGKVTKAGRHAGKADLVREILLNIALAEGEV